MKKLQKNEHDMQDRKRQDWQDKMYHPTNPAACDPAYPVSF